MDSWKSKVCMAFSGYVADNRYETMIFIVDLSDSRRRVGRNRDESPSTRQHTLNWGFDFYPPPTTDCFQRQLTMNPTVRLDWESFNCPGLCVLGSKLYVFDEYHAVMEYPNYEEKFKSDGRCVFSYELSNEVSNLKLEKEMMHKEAARMNHTKVQPKAAVTPDGKIIVFSSLIDVCSYGVEGHCDFELFDPNTDIWHKLPDLPVSLTQGPEYAQIFVWAFTFIKKKVFFLRTEVGVFTIDLTNPVEWKTTGSGFHGDGCIPQHCGDSFVVIERDLCLIPHAAFNIRVRGTQGVNKNDVENIFETLEFTFPGSSPPGSSPLSKQHLGITLLNYDEKRSFRVCIIRSGINDETKHPEMLLSVYQTHLASCKSELSTYRKRKVKENRIWWKRTKETFVLPSTSKVMEVRIVVPEKSPEFSLCSFSSVKN